MFWPPNPNHTPPVFVHDYQSRQIHRPFVAPCTKIRALLAFLSSYDTRYEKSVDTKCSVVSNFHCLSFVQVFMNVPRINYNITDYWAEKKKNYSHSKSRAQIRKYGWQEWNFDAGEIRRQFYHSWGLYIFSKSPTACSRPWAAATSTVCLHFIAACITAWWAFKASA